MIKLTEKILNKCSPKQKKSIQKIITSYLEKIHNKKRAMKYKVDDQVHKAHLLIEMRCNKEYKKFEKEADKFADTKIREIIGMKQVASNLKSIAKLKAILLKQIQLYARWSRADKDGYVLLYDTWTMCMWNECQWWHYFSKSKYPIVMFNINNIRPISGIGNKLQWSNDWSQWYMQPTEIESVQKIIDKGESVDYTREFITALISHYKALNKNNPFL